MHKPYRHLLIAGVCLLLSGSVFAGIGISIGIDDIRRKPAAGVTHFLLYNTNGKVLYNTNGKVLCNAC